MSDRDQLGKQLLKACCYGRTAEAKRLIAKGAPVDWQNPRSGRAPLHGASANGKTEIVMLLLENKCDTNATDKDGDTPRTPLIYAARYNYMTIARELAWSLCDLKIPNKWGQTAAEVAKEKGNDALAEYLASQAPREQAEIRADPSRKEALRKRYQPQAEQERRETLGKQLMDACCYGRTAEAKRLIAEGAPVEWQRWDGMASLHYASWNGHTEIVMLLLENKCNLNITTKKGDTPLILATQCNNMDAIRALVEAGCDITIRGRWNMTAAESANRGKGTGPIAEYLINEAPRIRFHSSARDESGQLHRVKGRCKRAANRDLKEIAGFDDHMLHKLAQFCTGRR